MITVLATVCIWSGMSQALIDQRVYALVRQYPQTHLIVTIKECSNGAE